VEENKVEQLRRLGMPSYEAKALATLLEEKELTAEEISTYSKVPKAKIYTVLESLRKRGLITVHNTRPKRYSGKSIDRIVPILIKQKEEELSKLRKEAEKAKKLFRGTTKKHAIHVRRIWGETAVWEQVFKMIREAEKEVLLLATKELYLTAFSKKTTGELGKLFFRRKKGYALNIISKSASAEMLEKMPTEVLEGLAVPEEKFRRVPDEMIINPFIVVDRRKVGLPIIDPKTGKFVGGTLIEGEELARPYVEYFLTLWETVAPVEHLILNKMKKELKRRRKRIKEKWR